MYVKLTLVFKFLLYNTYYILKKSLLSILHIYNYDEEDTSPLSSSFWNFFNALLTVSDRPDSTENNLSLTAYEAINTLIKNSATDCQDHLIKLIDPFIEKVYRTFDPSVCII